jgi:hypothetical protein
MGHIYDEPTGCAQMAWVSCIPELSTVHLERIRKRLRNDINCAVGEVNFDDNGDGADSTSRGMSSDRSMVIEAVEIDEGARCVVVYAHCGEQFS